MQQQEENKCEWCLGELVTENENGKEVTCHCQLQTEYDSEITDPWDQER